MRVDLLRLFTARQSPFPRDRTSKKGRTHPAPTSCRITSTTNREALKNRKDRLKNPPAGCIYARERQKEKKTKGPILNFSQGDVQNTLVT